MFLEFSRNRLASDEPSPGNSTQLYEILSSCRGIAWRHVTDRQAMQATKPSSGFSYERPGGGN